MVLRVHIPLESFIALMMGVWFELETLCWKRKLWCNSCQLWSR